MKLSARRLILPALALLLATFFFFILSPRIVTRTEKKTSPESLLSLPYLTHASVKPEDKDKGGVTIYDRSAASPGLNYYCTEAGPGGFFIDMEGNLVHSLEDRREKPLPWMLLEPYGPDRFLVISNGESLILLERDSAIVWVRNDSYHHDLAVTENGDIYVLLHKPIVDPRLRVGESVHEKMRINNHAYDIHLQARDTVLDEIIVVMSPEGEVKMEVSFADIFLADPSLLAVFNRQTRQQFDQNEFAYDVFHANTLEVVNRDVPLNDDVVLRKGDVLFCLRNLNLVGVLDSGLERVVWHWGEGELDWPHAPTLLDNGNILIFDNGGHRKYSRVIELDPRSGSIVWEYRGDPPDSFFTESRGLVQRLPNGNTLITESDKGRAFEVTPSGRVVWEFYIPVSEEIPASRATIHRLNRISPPPPPWLKEN